MSSNASFTNSSPREGVSKSDKSKRSSKYVELTLTDWKRERPNLNMDFLDCVQEPSAIVLPLESQETAVIDDLLTCFIGRNGDFIVANPLREPYETRTFSISLSISPKLVLAAQKALVLASHYSMVVRFIQDNRALEVGRVNQALACSIDKLVEYYLVNIQHLEEDTSKRSVNIQSFYHAIQPLIETMEFLSCVSERIAKKGARGGKTLSILQNYYAATHEGSTINSIALSLITQSSKPYLESVQRWIFRGIIFDPYNEFMIVDNPKIRLEHDNLPEEYWLKKYQVRRSLVPKFLESVSELILNSGKYLTVASHCVSENLSLNLEPDVELIYSPSESYINIIENAYKFSSKYLFNIILNDFNILDRMKSVKRYFLLQQGDFITTIFDICNEELNKLDCDIIPSRFAALVDVAIRVPSTNDDPFRESISLVLKPFRLIEQLIKIFKINTSHELFPSTDRNNEPLTGIDVFALTVKTQWPVSLIFNKKVITLYQMLFRHIVYVKYIEMLLFKVWLYDMTYKKKPSSEIVHLQLSFGLRNKMISFVQNMAYYMMEEIIEPYWADLISKIPSLESVDDLLKEHWMFVDICMRDCLLKDLSLFQNFRDILTVCRNFTEYMVTYEKKVNEIRDNDFINSINSFEVNFNEQSDKFLKNVTKKVARENNNKMFSILYRLDAMAFSEDPAE